MSASHRSQQTSKLTLVVVAIGYLLAGAALAQYPVGQGGRLLDANPQLGGSRINPSVGYYRPMSPLVGGNAFASGNVGRGLSLRSFSPITSPTAFRAGLGSGALSAFRRDSVGVADASKPWQGLTASFYFDPARTAPTAGYLKGYYQPGPTYPGFVPGPRQVESLLRNPSRFNVLQYGTPPAPPLETVSQFGTEQPAAQGPVAGLDLSTASRATLAPLASTIFGPQPPRLPEPVPGLVETFGSPFEPQEPGVPGPEPDASAAAAAAAGGPLDLRIWPEQLMEPLTPTPLGVVAQEEALRMLTGPGILELGEQTGQEAEQLAGLTRTPQGARPFEPDAASTLAVLGAPGLVDTSMLPGNDLFTDMQLALALEADPGADWFGQMQRTLQEAAGQDPALAIELQDRAATSAEEFVSRVLETPIQTFVGQAQVPLNAELQAAEAAMETGDYYEAVRHYERAHLMDPANPLPLVGKGHALLASGEYVSAAFNLIRGLERYPQLARFQLDLTLLMGGGEIVDIRRADLMQRLARHEDPELRFLLGYLELHTGNHELGLENLQKAAQEADPRSFIRRYPDLIRTGGLVTPPLLLPGIDETETPAPVPQLPAGQGSPPPEESR